MNDGAKQFCPGSQDLLLPTQPAAPGARDEVRKVMLELEEVREQLEVATKKERQMQKNQEQASRYTAHCLKYLNAINFILFIRQQESGASKNGKCQKDGEGEAA